VLDTALCEGKSIEWTGNREFAAKYVQQKKMSTTNAEITKYLAKIPFSAKSNSKLSETEQLPPVECGTYATSIDIQTIGDVTMKFVCRRLGLQRAYRSKITT
jgi:hypothetical protein